MIEKKEASDKLYRFFEMGITKQFIQRKMSLSFPTLMKKIKSNDWTEPELLFIENLKIE